MNLKILLVEDDDLIRQGLKVALEKEGYFVQEANSGNKAIEYLEEVRFHLLITDIMMEDGDGISLLKYINNKNIEISLFVISALGSEDDQLKAYNLDIIDYLVKPINFEIFKKKITNFSKTIIQESKIKLDETNYSLLIEGQKIIFSAKEFEVLKLLITFPNQIFSKYDILNEVWYGNMNMSEKIVEVTILGIRKKLQQHSDLIKTYRNRGYCYEEEI